MSASLSWQCCCWLVLAAASLDAAERIELIPFDAVWKYTEAPVKQGEDWNDPSFDDSYWNEGPGVHGAPRNEGIGQSYRIRTLLHGGEPLPFGQQGHYFRIRFHWTNNPEGVVLVSTNLIDDGAIFYLNGVQVARYNLPEGGSRFDLVAVRPAEVVQDGPIVLRLTSAPLRRGDNLLAVSLHQQSPASSDAILGVNLWAEQLASGPLSFLSQPESLTKDVGEETLLEAQLAGQLPYVRQWHKNGRPLPNATENRLRIASVTTEDAGTYRLWASNALGSIWSDEVSLTIEPEGVVTYHQVWKYFEGGDQLGPAWKDAEFNDADWESAPGPFGYVEGINYGDFQKPIRTRLRALDRVTHYFRTQFDWPHPTRQVALQLTIMLDDGAIIYLNGSEIGRLGMNRGAVTHLTPASGGVGKAVPLRYTLLGSLRRGRNFLAVEIHQTRARDPDMVFGMKLVAEPPPDTWLHLSHQPEDRRVPEGSSVQLEVGVQGSGADYQWFHENKPISEANDPILGITRAQLAHAGAYRVRIHNSRADLTSRTMRLTVLPDTNAPVLIEADGCKAREQIHAVFSEPIERNSATNTSHYRLGDALGQVLSIQRISMESPTNVTLHTSPRLPGRNYILGTRGVADVSTRTNRIAGDMAIPVRTRWPLLPLDATWKFQGSGKQFDPTWKNPGFDDRSWETGRGIFSGSAKELTVPEPRGTSLDIKPITTCFRAAFDFEPDTHDVRLLLRHVLDDGAVFYLNGSEAFRFNMPHGKVSPTTRARARVHTPVLSEPVSLPATLLRPGRNLLAVEVHRARYPDPDAVFACEVEAEVRSTAAGPVIMTQEPTSQTAVECEPVLFQACAAGASHWQWFRNGSPIPNATNRTFTLACATLDWNGARLRVEASNAAGRAASKEATLTVYPDASPLEFVDASASGRRLAIQFNKRVDPPSAEQPGSFSVTDVRGGVRSIESASADGRHVILATATVLEQGDTLQMSGIKDATRVGNCVRPGAKYAIGLDGILVPFDATWNYSESGEDLGVTWRAPDFDDSSWKRGPGLLGAADQRLGHPLRTNLRPPDVGGPITAYFRHRFLLPSVPEATRLLLRYYADDGAVFYLNGQEAHRSGVGLSQTSTNVASRQVLFADWEGPFEVQSSLLVSGTNVLAVEIHQRSTNNVDVIFGAELSMPKTAGRRL